jgi:hypothetical protein
MKAIIVVLSALTIIVVPGALPAAIVVLVCRWYRNKHRPVQSMGL